MSTVYITKNEIDVQITKLHYFIMLPHLHLYEKNMPLSYILYIYFYQKKISSLVYIIYLYEYSLFKVNSLIKIKCVIKIINIY